MRRIFLFLIVCSLVGLITLATQQVVAQTPTVQDLDEGLQALSDEIASVRQEMAKVKAPPRISTKNLVEIDGATRKGDLSKMQGLAWWICRLGGMTDAQAKSVSATFVAEKDSDKALKGFDDSMAVAWVAQLNDNGGATKKAEAAIEIAAKADKKADSALEKADEALKEVKSVVVKATAEVASSLAKRIVF